MLQILFYFIKKNFSHFYQLFLVMTRRGCDDWGNCVTQRPSLWSNNLPFIFLFVVVLLKLSAHDATTISCLGYAVYCWTNQGPRIGLGVESPLSKMIFYPDRLTKGHRPTDYYTADIYRYSYEQICLVFIKYAATDVIIHVSHCGLSGAILIALKPGISFPHKRRERVIIRRRQTTFFFFFLKYAPKINTF